ncbi:MAG: hypothetical protein LBG72_07135 [Spirochaetaceae bacterium]|jgi:hypothetical protein|nr:hypothetical protein [Spirochaetaceae bacterium]
MKANKIYGTKTSLNFASRTVSRGFQAIVCAVLPVLFVSWDSTATVAPSGYFPERVPYITSNTEPANTVVDIYSFETGRTTQAIVRSGQGSAGGALISREVAEALGWGGRANGRISVSTPLNSSISEAPSSAAASSRFSDIRDGRSFSGDPDYDSRAFVRENALTRRRETSAGDRYQTAAAPQDTPVAPKSEPDISYSAVPNTISAPPIPVKPVFIVMPPPGGPVASPTIENLPQIIPEPKQETIPVTTPQTAASAPPLSSAIGELKNPSPLTSGPDVVLTLPNPQERNVINENRTPVASSSHITPSSHITKEDSVPQNQPAQTTIQETAMPVLPEITPSPPQPVNITPLLLDYPRLTAVEPNQTATKPGTTQPVEAFEEKPLVASNAPASPVQQLEIPPIPQFAPSVSPVELRADYPPLVAAASEQAQKGNDGAYSGLEIPPIPQFAPSVSPVELRADYPPLVSAIPEPAQTKAQTAQVPEAAQAAQNEFPANTVLETPPVYQIFPETSALPVGLPETPYQVPATAGTAGTVKNEPSSPITGSGIDSTPAYTADAGIPQSQGLGANADANGAQLSAAPQPSKEAFTPLQESPGIEFAEALAYPRTPQDVYKKEDAINIDEPTTGFTPSPTGQPNTFPSSNLAQSGGYMPDSGLPPTGYGPVPPFPYTAGSSGQDVYKKEDAINIEPPAGFTPSPTGQPNTYPSSNLAQSGGYAPASDFPYTGSTGNFDNIEELSPGIEPAYSESIAAFPQPKYDSIYKDMPQSLSDNADAAAGTPQLSKEVFTPLQESPGIDFAEALAYPRSPQDVYKKEDAINIEPAAGLMPVAAEQKPDTGINAPSEQKKATDEIQAGWNDWDGESPEYLDTLFFAEKKLDGEPQDVPSWMALQEDVQPQKNDIAVAGEIPDSSGFRNTPNNKDSIPIRDMPMLGKVADEPSTEIAAMPESTEHPSEIAVLHEYTGVNPGVNPNPIKGGIPIKEEIPASAGKVADAEQEIMPLWLDEDNKSEIAALEPLYELADANTHGGFVSSEDNPIPLPFSSFDMAMSVDAQPYPDERGTPLLDAKYMEAGVETPRTIAPQRTEVESAVTKPEVDKNIAASEKDTAIASIPLSSNEGDFLYPNEGNLFYTNEENAQSAWN